MTACYVQDTPDVVYNNLLLTYHGFGILPNIHRGGSLIKFSLDYASSGAQNHGRGFLGETRRRYQGNQVSVKFLIVEESHLNRAKGSNGF